MSDIDALKASLLDSRARFGALVETLRPELHRYCSRMVGSALDGEDLVQEALAQAYYRLPQVKVEVPLRTWLFSIAHHKCVDFLRHRRIATSVELEEAGEPTVEIAVDIENRNLASHAFAQVVLTLPPRERAAVVLSEVLGFSLAETATVLETSLGGVKAALHRGREKLSSANPAAPAPVAPQPAAVAGYLDAFNRRDWPRLLSLFEEEVHLELVGHVQHLGRKAVESNYLGNFDRLPYAWTLVACGIDGEPAVLCLREKDGAWVPRHAIRVEWRGGRVTRIRDYGHAPYVLAEARLEFPHPPPPRNPR